VSVSGAGLECTIFFAAPAPRLNTPVGRGRVVAYVLSSPAERFTVSELPTR